MAHALNFLAGEGWEGIGYYLAHWNSDPFSLGCLIVLVILISGYFYGCIFRRFIEPLKKIDCTMVGVLFILALFQVLVFFMVANNINTSVAYYAIAGILVISPLLCLLTWSNPLPTWKNLGSLLVGIGICAALVYGSMNLNTNNIYFDSITYLSGVVESSKNELFGHMVFPRGDVLVRVDPFHDYTGYYYFWGMMIRWVVNLFGFKDIVTPIYIWGATVLYGMVLGMVSVNAASVLFQKKGWLGLIFLLGFMAPYYTNYFNTTLGFFGNTIRTAVIGACVLLAYLILTEKSSSLLFIPLTVAYFAALDVSSSSMFLIAMITAGLFFTMAFFKEKKWTRWAGFLWSLVPLLRMGLAVYMPGKHPYIPILAVTFLFPAVFTLVAWLMRKNILVLDKIFMVLFPIALVGILGISFVWRNSQYGYSYFFRTSSVDDMTVNMTSHVSNTELIRNIIFYALLALTIVNFKTGKKFKLFLYVILLLFINPLVAPAVTNLLTLGVYSRVFDLLNNPFTLCFLLYSFDQLIPIESIAWVVLALVSAWSAKLGWDTLNTPYSKALTVGKDDWNWEAKVTNDSLEMYRYINNAFSTTDFDPLDYEKDNRVSILSQDSGLKGYVPGIVMQFSTEDYRSALSGDFNKPISEQMIVLMYPDRKYTEDDFGDTGDYSKLGQLFRDSEADYIVLNNTLALWDERGWFYKPYQALVDNGMCENIFMNDSWVVLRMNKQWENKPKSPDRYWVHMYGGN